MKKSPLCIVLVVAVLMSLAPASHAGGLRLNPFHVNRLSAVPSPYAPGMGGFLRRILTPFHIFHRTEPMPDINPS